MTTQVSFPRFYRENGVRFITHLKNPRLMDYNQLVLPRESIIHWVDYEGKYKVGPPQDEPLLLQKDNRLYVEAISEYPTEDTKPGWLVVRSNVKGFVVQYDSENPNIKRMTKMVNEYVSNEVTPLYTYGLLNTVYRYKRYIDSEVNRWHNYYYTIFETALKVAKQSDRNQFIELQVPRSFPSFQSLKKGEIGIDKTNIRYMPSPDQWLVVAMWNLISDNEGNFIFKNYTLADFEKINIIWRIESKYLLTNMGVLLGFANGEEAIIKPIKLRKMLIRAFIEMHTGAVAERNDKKETENDLDEFTGVVDEGLQERYGQDEEDEDAEENMVDEYDDDAAVTSPFATDSFVKKDKLQQAQQSQNKNDVEEVVLDDDDGTDESDDDDDFLKTLSVVAEDESTAVDGYKAYVPKKVTGLSVIEDEGSKLVKAGVMSVGSFERLKRLSEASGDIADPLNPSLNISESSKITKEDIVIEDKTPLMVKTNDLQDESMQYSSLNKYSRQYIEKVHHKDILNSVMAIQKGGVIIKDYTIEPVESVNDKYNIHKVQIETIKGHVSTLSFKVPVIESDGTFKSSGSRRFLRKQRGDVPIRKVAADSVALTSYYSKMFVTRSDRKQFDIANYISNHVISSTIDSKYHITDIKFGDSFDGSRPLPRIYTTLSRKFISFVCRGQTLYFDINNVGNNFKDFIANKNTAPLAKDIKTGKTTMYIDLKTSGLLDSELKPLSMSLEEFIGIDINNLPVEYAEVNIFGKNIPLVLILGHHLGLGNLLKTLNLKPRREARNKRLQLERGEYAIKFKDEVLIFNRFHDLKANLIINGLARFKNTLNSISVYDLDNKSVYNDLFDEIKAPIKLLKESKDMFNLWVDPITESILLDMKEPTDLVLLFIRAAELLILDEHPDGMDIAYMRDKGYERIAGMIYSELVKATREYNTRSLYNNNKLTINPESVWFTIITDQTVSLVEDSNPIHNLKESELVIYSGAGGRSGTTMTASSRKYHKSNLGVTSEATVDSGDTGTIIYNVADPNYSSVYGLTSRVDDINKVGGAKLLSPSALLAPGGEHDD